ncbi:hypothetical protein [Fructobacillus cardui]|uniref:hypothetical protein n=1 Tax=Fructobacillus cardui TaxID=2893170 RepID=UPI00200A4736|nr:hypothetical protein [Fructobacillus cardui]MCK8628205.1 hypothetical protein [Fructobacillus cardui]
MQKYYPYTETSTGGAIFGFLFVAMYFVFWFGTIYLAWRLINFTCKMTVKFYKYLNQDPKWVAKTKAQYYGYYGHS